VVDQEELKRRQSCVVEGLTDMTSEGGRAKCRGRTAGEVRLRGFAASADNHRLSLACQPKLTEEDGKPEVSEGWRRERDLNPGNAFL
jgi:hypothetical protein